mgnify:FL=1
MENFLGGDLPKEDYTQNSINSEFNCKKAHINMGFFFKMNLNSILKEGDIYPLFGDLLKGQPYVFDFSSKNPKTLDYNLNNFQEFNDTIFDELKNSGMKWGIGEYLEERRNILRGSINIINEKRIYHLGLDIIVPYNSIVFCPLDGYVHKLGKETQKGNYGGYLILKHKIKNQTFYSLYGHLKTPHKIQLGQKILAGQELARIGKETDSGGWFCHLHLQIITQKAMNEGYSEWGYISEKLLSKVEEYFPNPNSLFKW